MTFSNLRIPMHFFSVSILSCWFPEIICICLEISGCLNLNRMKDYFEPETRLIVVQSLALSLIKYCFTLWGSTSDIHLNRIQKLQNFSARVAIGTVRKYEHISPFLQQLGWMKIKEKYVFSICVFVFKVVRSVFPGWLYDFHTVDTVTGINTRQAISYSNLVVRRAATSVGSREMNTRGPYLWNKLPQALRDAGSFNSFKIKLKEHILNFTWCLTNSCCIVFIHILFVSGWSR